MSAKEDYYKQTQEIDDVYKGLEEDDLQKAIAASKDESNKAIAASKNSSTRKNMPPKRWDPLNKFEKNPTNTTQRSRIKLTIDKGNKFLDIYKREEEEREKLKGWLPQYLYGAEIDIIQRDGNCFFRSITHQLRAYGFKVPDEYQTVRNLVADYIKDTTNEYITQIFNPTYTLYPEDTHTVTEEVTQKQYADRIRDQMWGSDIEAIAITNGCLVSLTENQDVCVIIYIKNSRNEIIKQNGLSVPRGLPIRLLFVGRNHYHRIYFDDINRQSIIYPEELISGQPINPDTGMTQDEEARQLEAYKRFNNEKSETEINNSSSKLACPECTYLNDAETKNCEVCGTALNKADFKINYEWRMSKKEKEEQLKEFEKYNNHRIVIVNEDSDEYVNLSIENLGKPFMIMGYQNGQPNLLYKSLWYESESDGIQTFTGHIDIPREVDNNNHKFTRYPNPSMLNVDGKTIVNISLHLWANIWDEDDNVPLGTVSETHDSGSKFLLIQMTDAHGVEKVFGTEDADFTSISLVEKEVLYMRHGERGMSFSPDTGVIALVNKENNPSCIINVIDPTDGRELILVLHFHRKPELPVPGGKPRRTRKSRKNRRRQTKRRR